MPIHLTWQSNPAKPTDSTNGIGLGLLLSGDDPKIVEGDENQSFGKVEIFEVGDLGSNKGKNEASSPRLIATFHGTFHRDTKKK
jgi:hypothetical protein